MGVLECPALQFNCPGVVVPMWLCWVKGLGFNPEGTAGVCTEPFAAPGWRAVFGMCTTPSREPRAEPAAAEIPAKQPRSPFSHPNKISARKRIQGNGDARISAVLGSHLGSLGSALGWGGLGGSPGLRIPPEPHRDAPVPSSDSGTGTGL